MPWWIISLIVVIGFIVIIARNQKRNLPVSYGIVIPHSGCEVVEFTPPNPSPDDLCLMALCYAVKMRWLLNNEPAELRGIMQELGAEVADYWNAPGDDLIARAPGARALREAAGVPKAVESGEVFRINFHRTEHPRRP